MTKKGIYYYTTEEHFNKLTFIKNDFKLDTQVALELLSNFTSHMVDFDGFTSVPFTKLQSITHNAKDYLNFFIENKMIFIDNDYIKGSKTRGYKLREENRSDVIKIEVECYTFLKEKINYFNSKKKEFVTKTKEEQFIKMKSDFKEFVGGININKALEHVQKIEDINARISQFKLVDKIKDNNLYFKRNKTNNRLDSNLTNLKSSIKFFNQNDYVQIDISNSQPYFLAVLINYLYGKVSSNTISLHNESRNTSISIDNQEYNSVPFCLNELKKIKKEEITKFTEWAVGGKFYDNFLDVKNDRKQVKKMMMCVLFSKQESYKKEKIMFEKHFAGIANWINAFKKENGYNQFAIMLQKMESNKVLDVICKKLTQQNIFVVTIHDSFIVKKEQFEEAFKIIKENFEIVPNFKFDYFKKEEEEIDNEHILMYCLAKGGTINEFGGVEKIKEKIKDEIPVNFMTSKKIFEYALNN